MARAHHRGNLFLAPFAVGRFRCERAEAPLARQPQGRAPARALVRAHRLAQRPPDPRAAQRLVDPPRAIAAPQQPFRPAAGIAFVVDIAAIGKARGDRCGIGRAFAFPSPFAQLAREIALQLARAGGEARDIGERQFLQPRGIERPRLAARSPLVHAVVGHAALFVPHSLGNGKV